VTLDLDALHEVPVFQRDLELYFRNVWIPPSADPDPFYVRPNEGRWPTDWTLYTAESEVVAWAEYCRNISQSIEDADITGGAGLDTTLLGYLAGEEVPVPARSIYEIHCSFDRLADLLSPWGQECARRAGFDLASLYMDAPYGDCPALSAAGVALGWEAMLVPSAAWRHADGVSVPIFEAGRPRIEQAFRRVPFGRPTVAMAAATAYPNGRRPDWLG
jgi:hypothetical protein